ncbi:MAG: histidine kinase [Ginsengibacter sp.]
MNIYPLIFSNNTRYRIGRHAIFWFMWIAYYTILGTYGLEAGLPLLNRFFYSLVEVTLSTPMDMIFCYSIIYFLLPMFLFKGRYISMIFLWLVFSSIFIAVFELYIAETIPIIRGWFSLPKSARPLSYDYLSFSLFSQINMEGCMAAAIKLGKISFISQKEIDLLRNEKASLETETGNSEMKPVFLVDIINRAKLMAIKKGLNTFEILTKISNIMINTIYENKNSKVSLKSELEIVKEYIELEQCTRDEAIEVTIDVSGSIESESIASFILLQCIQNAFNQVSVLNISNKKININIKVANKILEVLISWGKPMYTSTLNAKNTILLNLNNRLKLIYPRSHEMKVLIEEENIIVSLSIDLKGAIN